MQPTESNAMKPTPSDPELRDMLHEAVAKDLLGPAEGPEEEIVGTRPGDRYLVGKLAPADSVMAPEEIDDISEDPRPSSEEGTPETGKLLTESLIPSSFGMTFCVDASVKELTLHASWGHYQRVDSEIYLTDDGKPRKVWKRDTAGGTLAMSLSPGRVGPLRPDQERPGIYIEGIVRPPSSTGEKIITLFLVNDQEALKENRDEAWLFQPELIMEGPSGTAPFCRRPSGESESRDPERAALAMLYRDHVEFAVGHGVSVHAEVSADSKDRATSIRTKVIPSYDVPMTEAPDTRDIPGFDKLELDMMKLADLDKGSLTSTLSVLTEEYSYWIEIQEKRVNGGELTGHKREAKNALERCRKTLSRLQKGIEVLDQNQMALEAFQFMNRVMWQQRVRSIYSLNRRRKIPSKIEDLDIPQNRSWRPFQLAFILLTLPSLTDPSHPDRTDDSRSIADLLWFPTGGGKTEAYLGLAAYAMAIRRLQGQIDDLDGTHGLAVIMRYTLRLLTIQQFQRASALLCAMEVIRRELVANGDTRWGETPFRIGLWVGQKATPNTTEESRIAIEHAHGESWRTQATGTPAQLTSCPWCGSEIEAGRDIIVKKGIDRTLLFCSDKYGVCPFTAKKAPDEGLPVVVVDEEIYRLLPSMLIATVDKFAQMPWKGEVQTLFGKVSGLCPRHGFLTPESDDTGNHRKHGDLPATHGQECPQLRPPDLIIQDELHLISGPLGTLVGLYETAIDELCVWQHDGKIVRPKVIASTATIRKAKEQVHGIFLRSVEVFPPYGLEASDNFFSRQRPVSLEKPGRRYIGICSPGMSRPSVLIRVYVALLTAAQELRKQYGEKADPWMTLLGYFNSLRELGGMRRLTEDDVRTRCFQIERGEIEHPGLAQRDIRSIRELTSRISSTDIPSILDGLENSFPKVGEEARDAPMDIVLATNMISVGVDVQRLGLMVVNGQPKTTAEYIQATSRVGRRFPGIICTVFNWARPRDFSHYETFEHYHATFYQHVEALSVTPYATRAVDRGLTGTLVSLVRLKGFDFNPNEKAEDMTTPSDPYIVNGIDVITKRAWAVSSNSETKDSVKRTLQDTLDSWAHQAQQKEKRLAYRGRKDGITVGLLKTPGVNPWDKFTVPTSMREVEPGVSLILNEKIGSTTVEWKVFEGSADSKGEEEK